MVRQHNTVNRQLGCCLLLQTDSVTTVLSTHWRKYATTRADIHLLFTGDVMLHWLNIDTNVGQFTLVGKKKKKELHCVSSRLHYLKKSVMVRAQKYGCDLF